MNQIKEKVGLLGYSSFPYSSYLWNYPNRTIVIPYTLPSPKNKLPKTEYSNLEFTWFIEKATVRTLLC